MKRRAVIIIVFCFLFSIHVFGNPFAEQISGGKVSEKIELEIKEILKSIKPEKYPEYPTLSEINREKKLLDYHCKYAYFWAQNYSIKKTSIALTEHMPSIACGGLYSKYNYFYVNEDFYNQLTPNEKKYWILDAIDSEIYKQDNRLDLSTINFDSLCYKLFGMISIVYGLGGIFAEYKGNTVHKIFALEAYVFAGCFALPSFMFFLANKIALKNYKHERSRFYIDKEVVTRHNCLNEAKSFLQKVLDNSSLLSLSDEECKNIQARLDNLKK